MGRKSKLSEKQWEQIGKRFLAGESARALGPEFGLSEAAIRQRFNTQHKEIKTVANQLLAAEVAFKNLPFASQIATQDLAAKLRSISIHLAGAAEFGAATAHRLSGIANGQVQKIDDAEPLGAASLESLKGVSALTRLANDSSQIGINLLAANKEFIKESNAGGGESKEDFLKALVLHLPD